MTVVAQRRDILILEFEKKTFHEGINLTVRRGIKWSLQQADNVNIEYTRLMRCRDLRDYDLYLEHDEECRTVEGLKNKLKRLYHNFNTREIVTLVYFKTK